MGEIEDKKERANAEALDIAMFIGGRYYTAESFIEEAKRIGVMRRVAFIPRGIVLGLSRCFILTDVEEAKPVRKEPKSLNPRRLRRFRVKKRGVPRIIGYFVIDHIIVPRSLTEKYVRGEDGVEYVDESLFEVRGCGVVVSGGTYIADGAVLQRILAKLQTAGERIGGVGGRGFIVFSTPVYVEGLRRFRGIKYVDGDKILRAVREGVKTLRAEEILVGEEKKPRRRRKLRRKTGEGSKTDRDKEEVEGENTVEGVQVRGGLKISVLANTKYVAIAPDRRRIEVNLVSGHIVLVNRMQRRTVIRVDRETLRVVARQVVELGSVDEFTALYAKCKCLK